MDETGFLSMGGYADYVWPAYIVAALILVVLAAASLVRWRRVRAELARLEADASARRDRPGAR